MLFLIPPWIFGWRIAQSDLCECIGFKILMIQRVTKNALLERLQARRPKN